MRFVLDRPVIDPAALAAFVRAGGGPVVNDLHRRATNVQTGARARVGKRTRLLERSITVRIEAAGPAGVRALIGSDVTYALIHHEGSPAHIIRPVNRRMLRFPVGGTMVFARVVRHPGTRPNRYLVDSLPLAAE